MVLTEEGEVFDRCLELVRVPVHEYELVNKVRLYCCETENNKDRDYLLLPHDPKEGQGQENNGRGNRESDKQVLAVHCATTECANVRVFCCTNKCEHLDRKSHEEEHIKLENCNENLIGLVHFYVKGRWGVVRRAVLRAVMSKRDGAIFKLR